MDAALVTKRPFILTVDAGSHEEPSARYFASLDAAVEAMNAYPEHFRRFSWIGEMVPSSRVPVVHVKDGKFKVNA